MTDSTTPNVEKLSGRGSDVITIDHDKQDVYNVTCWACQTQYALVVLRRPDGKHEPKMCPFCSSSFNPSPDPNDPAYRKKKSTCLVHDLQGTMRCVKCGMTAREIAIEKHGGPLLSDQRLRDTTDLEQMFGPANPIGSGRSMSESMRETINQETDARKERILGALQRDQNADSAEARQRIADAVAEIDQPSDHIQWEYMTLTHRVDDEGWQGRFQLDIDRAGLDGWEALTPVVVRVWIFVLMKRRKR